jgi:hypothetical protein
MFLELGNIRYGHRVGTGSLAFVMDSEQKGTVRFASQTDKRIYETTTGWVVDENCSAWGDLHRKSWICLHGEFTDVGKAEWYQGLWRVPDNMR